jgi:hypothetical protein
MTIIRLRNKNGQFCTFGEFCSTSPAAIVRKHSSPREAYEQMEKDQRSLSRMRFYSEIIDALKVPENVYAHARGITFSPDGRWYGEDDAVLKAEVVMVHNQWLANLWTTDHYEVD